jgi:hypothetical protein
MRRSFAFLLLAAACGSTTKETPAPRAAGAAQPPLAVTSSAAPAVTPREPVLVVLVVDQFAAWIASDRLHTLPVGGGFARLRRDGLYVRELRYQHATTATAPGHAALFTGLPPRESRVFANDAFDPVTKAPATILKDPGTHVVGGLAGDTRSSSSAHVLGPVKTLGDALREQRPNAAILTMSMKDRGAIFAAGKHPDAALWFDAESRGFVTSSAFAKTLPTWVAGFNQRMAKYWSSPWTRLNRPWVERHAATPDLQPGERDLPGLGLTFDHAIEGAEKPVALLHLTPFADTALLELAIAGVDAAPGSGPLYVGVSLSSFDYVGHTFGPDSHESWDELYRLDATLSAFFAALDRRFPKGYSVMLSADHGAPPLPETANISGARPWCDDGTSADRFQRPCGPSKRVAAKSLQELATAVAKKAKRPDAVLGLAGPLLFLRPESRSWPKEERGALLLAIKQAISKLPEVAEVIETSALPETCPPGKDESLLALVCRSVLPGSGDLYIVLEVGSFFDVGDGKGVNHSSPYLYDRSVPLFVMSANKRRAGQVFETPVSPQDFVRTAATLLGIEAPPGARTGRDLTRP